jgi:DNA-binding transcriptional MerR regulator
MQFPIGHLSKITHVKIPTIRFYEQIGLLKAPDRTVNRRRSYGHDAIRRLTFVKNARHLGFSVDAVRALLELSEHPDRQCGKANEIAEQQLADVDTKIKKLKSLRQGLQRMIDASCKGRASDCRVMDALVRFDVQEFMDQN